MKRIMIFAIMLFTVLFYLLIDISSYSKDQDKEIKEYDAWLEETTRNTIGEMPLSYIPKKIGDFYMWYKKKKEDILSKKDALLNAIGKELFDAVNNEGDDEMSMIKTATKDQLKVKDVLKGAASQARNESDPMQRNEILMMESEIGRPPMENPFVETEEQKSEARRQYEYEKTEYDKKVAAYRATRKAEKDMEEYLKRELEKVGQSIDSFQLTDYANANANLNQTVAGYYTANAAKFEAARRQEMREDREHRVKLLALKEQRQREKADVEKRNQETTVRKNAERKKGGGWYFQARKQGYDDPRYDACLYGPYDSGIECDNAVRKLGWTVSSQGDRVNSEYCGRPEDWGGAFNSMPKCGKP
ncbi:MAG: hypothetical protein A2W19_02955 [Spirochaetes bacterium RBG_16_49_21]|nr:MAG: hypothetical protein A2W19_02955 [Spirochaetes bacterium RBG_16_49_21]